MMMLGIDRYDYLVYEGVSRAGRGIWPSPIIASAKIENSSTRDLKGPVSWQAPATSLIFREDAYDPVSRIRRGRFYKASNSQPELWIAPPHPASPPVGAINGLPHSPNRELLTFNAHRISRDILAIQNSQPLIILGDQEQFSVWTFIGAEMVISGEEIVALRARSTFGALPHILMEKMPGPNASKALKAIDDLSEDLRRAGPQSIIDRSRDVVAWLLGIYLQSNEKIAPEDLASLIKRLINSPDNVRKDLTSHAANIVRLLHARWKSSVQARFPTSRDIHEQDAELAVLCVSTILCDLGWAVWQLER